MNRRVVQRIFEKVSPLVAKQLGVGAFGTPGQLVFGRKGAATMGWNFDGAAALSGGGVTAVSNMLLKRGSRADIRGALAHELTHRYDEAYGLKDSETRADAVRLAVNGRRGSLQGAYDQWSPGHDVTKYARHQGWTSATGNNGGGSPNGGGHEGDNVGNAGTRGNGPGYGNQNRSNTRNRNTLRNNASKNSGKAPPPTLSPSQSYSYAEQLAGLQRKYAAAAALSKANIAAARGTFQSAHAAAKETRISETADAVNNALDRGLVGSSIDLGARAGAVTDAASQLEAARIARDQAIAGERSTLIGAQGDYYTGVGAVGAEKANALAEAAATAFQEDQFDVMNQNYNKLLQNALANRGVRGRNRDGNGGGTGGGGSGSGVGNSGLQKAGSPNTPAGLLALYKFYKKNKKDWLNLPGNADYGYEVGGAGQGLPYTPRGRF